MTKKVCIRTCACEGNGSKAIPPPSRENPPQREQKNNQITFHFSLLGTFIYARRGEVGVPEVLNGNQYRLRLRSLQPLHRFTLCFVHNPISVQLHIGEVTRNVLHKFEVVV